MRILALASRLIVFGILIVAALAIPTAAQPYADETPAQRDARMKWWREARFGMFIHWGVYSVPAGTYHGKQVKRHRRMDHATTARSPSPNTASSPSNSTR